MTYVVSDGAQTGLGAIVGAVLGLTGTGGGILAVRALVAGMGWPMPHR